MPEPVIQLSSKERFERDLPKIADFDPKKQQNVEQRWGRGDEIGNGVFVKDLLNRALNEETQRRLAGFGVLKKESTKQKDYVVEGDGDSKTFKPIPNRNIDGFMFALHFEEQVVGVIRKGPVGRFEGKRMNETAANSQRVLLTYGNKIDPKFIAFAESSTDSVTDFQEQKYREDTLWVATAGNPKETELAMIYDLARKYPEADWRFIGQNDEQNVKFEADVHDAVATGNPKAKFEVERPEPQFKDVSEALQARIKSERAEPWSEDVERTSEPRKPQSMAEWADQIVKENKGRMSSTQSAEEERKRQEEQNLTQGPRRGR